MSILVRSMVYNFCQSVPPPSRLGCPKLKPHSTHSRYGLCLFASLTLSFLITPSLYAAHQAIPGEDNAGFFYSITHLHPVAYVILFCIFGMSLLNLYYLGWISTGVKRLLAILGLGKPDGSSQSDQDQASYPQTHTRQTEPTSRRQLNSKDQKENVAVTQEGIIATRRAVKQVHTALTSRLTPLDGFNHPIPNFSGSVSVSSQAGKRHPTNAKRRFKFTAAVDLPSPEEIEQRSHQRLIVTGTVKGPDAKGLPSVLVFLSDVHGNRLGQSARSMVDTGEFKVQANEPGRYLLNAYKRGYVQETSKPITLAKESGRIEGIRIRMRPEGCLVHGRVIDKDEKLHIDQMEVICIIQNESVPFSTRLASGGVFRIPGVPHDSKCYIEILRTDGTIVARTDVFDTEKNKDVYREIVLPDGNSEKNSAENNPPNVIGWSASGNEGEEVQPSLLTAPMDQH